MANAPFKERVHQLAMRSDGGFYVGWLDEDPATNLPGQHDIRLQRFDAAGQAMWPSSGLLVADLGNPNDLGLSLAVDAADNVALAFRDDRFGSLRITVTLIDAAGQALWGPDGVQHQNFYGNGSDPHLVAATDGAFYLAWDEAVEINLRRLDATGHNAWATTKVFTDIKYGYNNVGLVAGDNGSVLWVREFQSSGFPGVTHRSFACTKFDAQGVAAWSPSVVTLSGPEEVSLLDPVRVISDQAGGAYFAWTTANPAQRVRAQHMDLNGNLQFAVGGALVSNKAGGQMAPELAFDAQESEFFVAYTEVAPSGAEFNVGLQKIGPTGLPLWSPSGVTLEPLNTAIRPTSRVASLNKDAVVAVYTLGINRLVARRYLDDGTPLGAPTPNGNRTLVAASPNPIEGLQGQAAPLGHLIVSWEASSAATQTDLFVQDVLPNGTLGGLASVTPLLGSGANPVALSSTGGPRLGQTWNLVVDKAADPAALATAVFVYGKALAMPIVLPEGEVLVDATSALLLTSIQVTGGSVDTHALSVPAVISYVGLTINLQAALAGPSGTLLTNGLQASLGF